MLKLKTKWLKAREAYHNSAKGKTLMTDAEFDKLEAQIEKVDPGWCDAQKAGPAVSKKVEVKLRQFMPSLLKAYPEKIDAWFKKNKAQKYLVMAKLDGASLLLTLKDGEPHKLVTRGDGTLGKDISFLIPYLHLPSNKSSGFIDLRLEAVLPNNKYEKYKDEFDTPRAMVSGLLNRSLAKINQKALLDIDFVILGQYGAVISETLKIWSFKVVYSVVTANPNMSKLLSSIKDKVDYNIDGLVICPVTFELNYDSPDKPKGIIAYKENVSDDDAVRATVKDIIYQTSARGRIVPKLKLRPVTVGDVTVTHATLHNAKWMIERKIGPGSIVKIVRSGEVIPKVVGVVKAAEVKYPEVRYKLNGVHFETLDDSKEETVNVLEKFFVTLGVEGFKAATIKKCYDAGMTAPIHFICDWGLGCLKLKTIFPGAVGLKIQEQFNSKLQSVPIEKLMVASNCFGIGIGERKLQAIINHYKTSQVLLDVINDRDADVEALLLAVDGFQQKTVKAFMSGIEDFRSCMALMEQYIAVTAGKIKTKHVSKGLLINKKVSFTGYRSKEQEAFITKEGGEVIKLSAKTDILLYNPEGRFQEKVENAKAKGILVVTFENLIKGKP